MAYKSKYTGLQIDDILDSVGSKQTQIEDLESIRAGAQKGATALQSYTEKYNGTVTGVKINGSTKNPSNGVVDLGTVITSHQTLKTINGESIIGSGDIVIEGGSSSGGSGAYSEVNHGTSDTTFALTPNTFHIWDEVSSLTLTLVPETSGVANEFLFQFTSGATATTLSLPSDLKWANDAPPTIAENMIYQVSILKGLASVLEFSNAARIFVFTINGGLNDNPLYAENGMTWEQWCESDYNIGSYWNIVGGQIRAEISPIGWKYIVNESPSNVINADITYQTTYYSNEP